MAYTDAQSVRAGALGEKPVAKPAGYLFGPKIDFFCLGGGSLVILPFFAVLVSAGVSIEWLAFATLAMTHLINNPHFAHSYQIFYRGFREKIFGTTYSRSLRVRYAISGLIVPIALLVFFSFCIVTSDVKSLAYAANALLFLVGWHYVKQGYGMLILDSVLKRLFFTDREKKLFLANSYTCWIFYWLLANWTIAERNFAGLRYYMVDVSIPILCASGVAAFSTSVAAVWFLYLKWRANDRALPINGVIAYVVTLYVWLFLRLSPAFLMVIPMLHSLQYLVVVWRYQINSSCDRPDASARPASWIVARYFSTKAISQFVGFVGGGVALGFFGFWVLPVMLKTLSSDDTQLFSGTLFFFVVWIFINIHHYFMDTVIWRRGNPDTQRLLFAHGMH